MQLILIQLPLGWTIALFAAIWFLLHLAASVICHRVNEKYLTIDAALFKSRTWEQEGKIYDRFLRVKKWKKLLPEIYLFRQGEFKGALYNQEPGAGRKALLEQYLLESCRAELSHWLAILPFWIFGFFAPPAVILYMLLYALAANLPCIIVQRFNRPRIARLLSRTGGKPTEA
jgi:glycosyl-4,4'-diaponeurosporenoate acyltransferase